MGKTVLTLFFFLFALPVVFTILAFELGLREAISVTLEDLK